MIATGSNEVRQVFVGDGQVHGEITYEYLIEPEVNRQLENVAIPYKNNPAYVDRITVTRRTIQNGNIIAIDYKDVLDVDPNQDANDSEYCVWFANDKILDTDNEYTTKIAILNRKGFREFEDKIVQVPMKNPFDDADVPYINLSIKQLYQRCAFLIDEKLIMVKPDGTVVERIVGNSADNSDTVNENVTDLYICGEICLVVTLWKTKEPDTDGNYATGFGVQRFKLNPDSIDWTGHNWVINNAAGNDYVDNFENKIVYDPFHDVAYVRYAHTNTVWKLDVSRDDLTAFKLEHEIHNIVYLTSISSVACMWVSSSEVIYVYCYNNIHKKGVMVKTIPRKGVSNIRLDVNCIPTNGAKGYMNYKSFNTIYYDSPSNVEYYDDKNVMMAEYIVTNSNDAQGNYNFAYPCVAKLTIEDMTLKSCYRLGYQVQGMGDVDNQYRTQFDNYFPFYYISYNTDRTMICLAKKNGYSDIENIVSYPYPLQSDFSRYKPGIVLAKG